MQNIKRTIQPQFLCEELLLAFTIGYLYLLLNVYGVDDFLWVMTNIHDFRDVPIIRNHIITTPLYTSFVVPLNFKMLYCYDKYLYWQIRVLDRWIGLFTGYKYLDFNG